MACAPDEVKNPLPGPAPGPGPDGRPADKAAWRAWARRRRRLADPAVLARRSAALRAVLARYLDGRPPTTVLLYRSMGAELSLDELAETVGRHRWATTRTPVRGPLSVHPWSSPTELHRFGFHQPVADAPLVPWADIGVVLVPGLVFDRAGVRIGYGKGYYDRLLATALHAVRIGVAEPEVIVERLPSEVHDIPMHLLATPEGLEPVIRPRV